MKHHYTQEEELTGQDVDGTNIKWILEIEVRNHTVKLKLTTVQETKVSYLKWILMFKEDHSKK